MKEFVQETFRAAFVGDVERIDGSFYQWVRAVIGVYLLVHFVELVPYGAELFSSQGVLPRASLSPLSRAFPNLLSVADSPAWVSGVLVVAIGASVAFALGIKDRIAAIVLWYIWACLLGRDPLIMNPGIPYVGWALLAHACLPSLPGLLERGEEARRERLAWRMPRAIHSAAWIVMVVGYSYSGWMKLASPSWIDGSAISRVLESPLARPGMLRELLVSMPGVLKLMTYATLGLELFAAPLALSGRVRPLLWAALVSLHLGILATVAFADLTLGMLVIHLIALPTLTRRSS